MGSELTVQPANSLPAISDKILEQLIATGDLSKLTPSQRNQYYCYRCKLLGLDPATKPFGYIVFPQGGMKLYAERECTEQLRRMHSVSIASIDQVEIPGCVAFRAKAVTLDGRSDTSIGAVPTEGKKGLELANAVMKAETKAKRRVTLSLMGLGLSDESEIDSIKGAKVIKVEAAHGAEVETPPTIECPATGAEDTLPPSFEGMNYRIKTKCSFNGMSLAELKSSPKWAAVTKVYMTPQLRDSLDRDDVEALAPLFVSEGA